MRALSNLKPLQQKGFSLIELMIGMVLGLLIMGAVISVALSSLKTYRTTKAVNEIHDNARYAFEFVGRDIREAGFTPCGNDIDVANVLLNYSDNNANTSELDWWGDMSVVSGLASGDYSAADWVGTDMAVPWNGSPVLRLQTIDGAVYTVVDHSPPTAATMELSPHDIDDGDILLVCDYESAAIFQANVNGSDKILHPANKGSGAASLVPGNCSKGLGYKPACKEDADDANGKIKSFEGGQIVRLQPKIWYVGCNGRPKSSPDCSVPEGRSIFFTKWDPSDEYSNGDSRSPGLKSIELVSGVKSMGISYRESSGAGNYVSAPSNWDDVNAIKLNLELENSSAGVGGVSRSFEAVFALRNRLL